MVTVGCLFTMFEHVQSTNEIRFILIYRHWCDLCGFAGSDFLQQRLRAWQPILTPRWIIASFFALGIIFVPVGVVLKQASDDVCSLV